MLSQTAGERESQYLLFIESAAKLIFHIGQVIVNIGTYIYRKVHACFFDVGNGSHLLDCVLNLVHKHLFLHDDLITTQRVKSLFWAKKGLKWLVEFTFYLVIDPV